MLKIISLDKSKKGNKYFFCECSRCGNIKSIRNDAIKRGQETCGCFDQKKDIVGNKYGMLLVLRYSHTLGRKPYWEVKCECGNIKVICGEAIKSGNTKSCGCTRSKLGIVSGRMYQIFMGMKQRCNYINHISYDIYGGKGIKMIWDSFDDFYNDMHISYYDHVKIHGEKNTTIDRIDSNGNYCKDNCRWATYKVQGKNTIKRRYIIFFGKPYRMSDLARKLNIRPSKIYYQIKTGKNLEEIYFNKQ